MVTKLLAIWLLIGIVGCTPTTLLSYNIDLDNTTVSGLSAGGYMASQLHFAHSESIIGAAIFAAGPFFCARGNLGTALYACMATTSDVLMDELKNKISELAINDHIDALSGISGDKVFLFSGTQDTTVLPAVVEYAETIYDHYGATVTTAYTLDAGHGFPTVDSGNTCGTSSSPYINDCDYNGAEEMFETILASDLKTAVSAVTENLIEFDQSDFYEETESYSFYTSGYVYVPTNCQEGKKCSLHIALHGCNQTIPEIGTAFVSNLGLNGIAEANEIIVLYPQMTASDGNPNGCFDWWGYTKPEGTTEDWPNYVYKEGPQVKAIWDMATRLEKDSANTISSALFSAFFVFVFTVLFQIG